MSSEIIFFIIVVFLCLDFVLERVLESLNSKHMSPVLPDSLKGIYEEKEYSRFQSYKRENGRLDSWSSGGGFVVMIVFLVAGGFGWYNSWVVSLTDSVVWQTILFVVGLSVVSSVLDIPFDYYATFRIEEKYGFNKTTRRVYWLDTVKELFLSLVLGGVLLALVVWFYTWAGTYFWLYAWGAVTLFSVFMAMFYSQLIVPLFNKQTPLQEGSLRDKIQAFAGKVGFKLDNIYVIDGSKRSTKANAYFTGLGPKKRVVLYDTLIDELTEEEIVAVLAHEVRELDDDGLRLGAAAQEGDAAGLGDGQADDADGDGDGHGDHHPDSGDAAGEVQLLLLPDGHEAQEDVGHAEVAEPPCQGGEDAEGTEAGGAAGGNVIALGQVQIAGQGPGVLQHGVHAAGLAHTEADHHDEGNGHKDALHQVRGGDGQEAAHHGIGDDDHGADDHGGVILKAEEAV